MKLALQAAKIFDGQDYHQDCSLLIDGTHIVGIVSNRSLPTDYQLQKLKQGLIAPGFIDWQVNGGGGVLFNNDRSPEALHRICQGHYTGGTTSLMPTLISDTREARIEAANAVQQAMAQGQHSVLGVHFEGPFFSSEKRGTHAEQYLSDLDDQEVDWLCGLSDLDVLVTLAPERCQPGQIRRLAERGIRVSAGHSNATAKQVSQAINEGLRGFTHLYNAMSTASSREPGVTGKALTNRTCWCGIIVDGHHVHADMVRLAIAAKPTGKVCLVTDAMATVGSSRSYFELYGQRIEAQDGRLINSEGVLAGSTLSMIEAVKNTHQWLDLPLSECLRMASLYPAEFLQLDHQLGRLLSGYRADVVHLSPDLAINQVWVAGQPVYQA